MGSQMVWTVLFLSVAGAADISDAIRSASGTWQLADAPSQVAEIKESAIDKTLQSMNFAIRGMARDRVSSAVTACGRYAISVSGAVMTVTCDAKPALTLNLDGSRSTYTSDAGKSYTVNTSVSGDQVTARFTGGEATMQTTYRFTGGQLMVTKIITSEHFGEPLKWTNGYQK